VERKSFIEETFDEKSFGGKAKKKLIDIFIEKILARKVEVSTSFLKKFRKLILKK